MKALRWHAQKDIRLEDVPEPELGPDLVKIKVKWCGICGTDIHEYEAGPLMIRTTRPHPVPGSKVAPVTIGHEFSGEVVATGDCVENTAAGDRVVVRPTIPCYRCRYCRQGRYIQCPSIGTIGYIWDGGFAEYAVVPSDNVIKIPDTLSYEAAAFVEPLASALQGVKRGQIPAGAAVAVIGAGPIGLLAAHVARALGAGQVFVLETIAQRIEVAAGLGFTAINPAEADAGKEIASKTDGLRADVVFECAGPPAALLSALKISARGGTIVEIGQMVEPCSFPFGTLWMHEKSILTSQGYTNEFPAAITFLSDGRVKTERLTTAKIGLDRAVDQGFDVLTSDRKYEHLKILVSPEL